MDMSLPNPCGGVWIWEVTQCLLVGEAGDLHPLLGREEALVHHDVRALGLLGEPLVGDAVAPEHEAQAIPVEPEADGAVADVDGREGRHLDAVGVVDHGGLRVVELVGDDLPTGIRQGARPGRHVPGPRLSYVIDVDLRAELRGRARRAVDVQRGVATVQPAPDPERRDVADVVGVEVAGEDLVQRGVVDLEAGQSIGGSRPQVEDEGLAVAELDQERRGDVAGRLIRHAGPQRHDAHLARAQLLGVGIVGPGIAVVQDLLGDAAERYVDAIHLVRLGRAEAGPQGRADHRGKKRH
jgi:hypothetical protein